MMRVASLLHGSPMLRLPILVCPITIPRLRPSFMLWTLLGITIAVASLLCIPPVEAQSISNPKSNLKRLHSDIKSDLKAILSQPEFQPESTRPGWLAEKTEKIRSQLSSLWDRFRRLFGGGPGISAGFINVYFVYTLIAIIAAVAALALYRVIVTRGSGRRRSATRVNAVSARKAEEEPEPAPDEWIAQADRLARDHDYRGAFRAVFLAILIQLDRAGKIEYEKSRTNGDYLRLLRAGRLRSLYELFVPLAREFDLRWYGGRPSLESDYRRCLDAYHQLLALITATPPSTTASGAGKAPSLSAQEG